jgi:subtilisin family serine protease
MSLQEVKQKAGWEITAFNLPDNWNITAGEGVKVAILDSGCNLAHPDLVDNLLPGMNFLQPNSPPEDDNGHGTHCAGILAASNNEIGVVGVAPKTKIIPVKVLDRHGSGQLDIVARAIYWATDNGADLISMSLGSPTALPIVQKAIQYAASKGVVTFCAAGNAGKTAEVFYPAAYAETIAIGSIDETMNRSSFSNTGHNLDFLAPGGKILSTYPPMWYSVLSGTSMACPFATGVASMFLSFSRKTQIKEYVFRTAEAYRNAFKENATSLTDPEYADKKFFQGFGIIDPRKFKEWCEAHKI